MLDIDSVPTIGKGLAVIVGVLCAYGADGKTFRAVLRRFLPKKSRERVERLNCDGAWRELMDDSIARDDATGVEMLNKWMTARTESALGQTTRKAS